MFVFKIVLVIVNALLYLLEILLVLRFILRLLGANATDLVGWIYNTTAPYIQPFTGIFALPEPTGVVIEFATLVALVVYGVISGVLTYMINSFNTSRS